MEIPEMNMISDFEAGMKCLQNPPLISRFFSFELVPQLMYSFWKWGALIFAIYATFIGVIKRIRLMFVHFHKPYLQQKEQIEFNEDDDISLTSSSDDDEQEEEEENSPTTSYRGQHRGDEDFRVKGRKSRLRQRRRVTCGEKFDWSEFTSGKNVVKLWDSLSLGLNFVDDFDSNDVVSKWDSDEINKFSSRRSYFPAVVLTAEGNEKGDGVVFRGYDARMRSLVPAFFAEWRSAGAEVPGVAGVGVGKVFVIDDVSEVLTVGDVRNVRMPLENGKEFDGVTWWDTDAVIVEDDYVLVD